MTRAILSGRENDGASADSGGAGARSRLRARLLLRVDSGMSSGKAGYWDTERRAGDVIESHVVAEPDGFRLATMLTADTKLKRRSNSSSVFDCNADEPPNTTIVEHLEWIFGENVALEVRRQKGLFILDI